MSFATSEIGFTSLAVWPRKSSLTDAWK